MDECIICFENVDKNEPYVIINNESDKNLRFHGECIKKWLDKSNKCMFSDEPIKSYSVYCNDEIIETHLIIDNLEIIPPEQHVVPQVRPRENIINCNYLFVIVTIIILLLIIVGIFR